MLRSAAEIQAELDRANERERERKKTSWLAIFTVAVIVLAIPAVWIAKSHQEAKAFNRLTGKDATTWEAMWVELRVQ